MWRYLMCILTTSSNLLPRSSPNNFDKHASHLAVGVSQERNNKFNDMSVVFFYLLRLHTKGQKALQKLISFSPLTLQVLSEANLVCSEVRLPRHPGADTSNSYYCHWTLPLASQGLWFSTPDVIIHARALTRLLWNSILCFCNHRTPFSSWPNDIDIVFVRRPTSDVDIFVFPVDPRHLPAKVEGAVAKNKAWNVKKEIQISTV